MLIRQGGYTKESCTRCLLVLAVYELKLGCSLPASALATYFGLFLKALPKGLPLLTPFGL